MTFGSILFIFILIVLNGFFVGVEFAAVASRRARLDLLAQSESRPARLVRAWLEKPAARDRLIAASQLGITVVSLALGAVGENTFEAFLEPLFKNLHPSGWLVFLDAIFPALPLVLSLVVVTSLHVVLGEQVPKVAVLRSPERFALFAAPLMQIFSTVFKGFVSLLDWATRMVLRLVGIPASSSLAASATLEEVRMIVSGPEVQSVIEESQRKMLSAVIDFGELVVRQVYLPRTEIIAVEVNDSLQDLIRLVTEHPISKIPVFENDLDHIVGIVHIRDILHALQDGKDSHCKARELMHDALYVPETASVNDLLRQFRARHTHVAVVLDEFGGTAGLVTLEDLLEEIVGEVNDSEAAHSSIQVQPDGSIWIDGLTLIEEVNQHFGLHLTDPNYDTIAGFVLGKLGRIPRVGDEVEDEENGVYLRVKSMDHMRIAQVVLSRLAERAQS